MRIALALVAVVLFVAAMLYPFQPSTEQGWLGPLGQMLFFYFLIGWFFLLIGVDPTGAGSTFAFFSPWPTFSIALLLPIVRRPTRHYSLGIRIVAAILALWSPVVAIGLSDPVSTIPLWIWSVACMLAAGAILMRPPATESAQSAKARSLPRI